MSKPTSSTPVAQPKHTPTPRKKGANNGLLRQAIAQGLRLDERGNIVLPSGRIASGNSGAYHNYRRVWITDSGGRRVNFTRARVLCWLVYGPPPAENCEADHINGDRSDDRIENLRWATPKQNAGNIRDSERERRSIVMTAAHAAIRRKLDAHEALVEALRELAEHAAREIDVPLDECVAGPIGKARAALALAEAK